MLRFMTGMKMIEKIRTQEIRARTGVANISETIREVRPRWLGSIGWIEVMCNGGQ